MKNSLSMAYAMKRRNKNGISESLHESLPTGELHHDDLVDRIMEKRQMMSEGGRVANGGDDDLESMADSRPDNFDDLALRDDLESTNSGAADGDFLGSEQEDEDRRDIVAKVMRQRSMKQRNPRIA